MMLGAGAGFGVALAAFKYTNGIGGYVSREDDQDEVERREELRKLRRRPLQETLEQLGEGRGAFFFYHLTNLDANMDRYLRSRIRGAET